MVSASDKKLTLYWTPLSQPARAVAAICELKNIPFESKILNMLEGEHKKPEFLAVNPAGVVPCIQEVEGGETFTLS